MIVTTAQQPSTASREKAARLSAELGAKLVQRRGFTVKQLIRQSADRRAIVVTEHETRFYDGEEGAPLFFHPSMAFVRVKRLRKGESDPLIELSGCRPGDRIIDCTAGMAADSLVFSYAAGRQGIVTALESEPVLGALVREGLSEYDTGLPEVDEAMRRIRLLVRSHIDYLAEQPDNSAEIVYFDPMFRQPILDSAAIGAFRTIANDAALSEEAVRQAVRVATRAVIMKEHGASGEFARLGFRKRGTSTSKIAYGVIPID